MNTKTLVIHPKDNTTTFLNGVYANIAEKTVIQSGVSKRELIKLMKTHDRIMMMGHGSPEGLFSLGLYPNTSNYVIDDEMTSLLNEKNDTVFIWCYASSFMRFNKLKGFGTGMFISEVLEAFSCGLNDIDQNIIDESNTVFVNEVSNNINIDSGNMFNNIIEGEYKKLAELNPVAKFNYDRLYHSGIVHKYST